MAAGDLQTLFVSATATDCAHVRQELKEAVEAAIESAKIHLQEDWTEAAVFVLDACRDRVRRQDGYFGLFGHRYGWVPPGVHEDSITKLEWKWAVERWEGQREAPIFIMLPQPGSAADQALQASADEVLAREFPRSKAKRQASLRRQQAFVDEVKRWAAGRIIVFYASEQQLRERGLACVLNWNLNLYKRAGARRGAGRGAIPSDVLGRLGREAQIEQLEDVLDAWRRGGGPRATAFAVHGPQNHGQRQFGDLLASWDGWEDWGHPEVLDGHADQPDNPAALARWLCGLLKQPVLFGQEIPALAQALSARLQLTSVVVLLRALGDAPDRWQRFASGFWQPLRQALDLAWAVPAAAPSGRLFFFVVDHQDAPVTDVAVFDTSDPARNTFDPARVAALPALSPITEADVIDWLKDMKKRGELSLAPDRRDAIARVATTPDDRPAEVYERLHNQHFWA